MNILSKVKKSDIVEYPFPHVIIRDCLESDFLEQLLTEIPNYREFPGFQDLENYRMTYPGTDILSRNDIGKKPALASFIESNRSEEYASRFLDLFGRFLEKDRYFTETMGKPGDLSAGILGSTPGDIMWDAGIGVNTPNPTKASSVRGPHIDKSNKLNFGLLYLKHPNDTAGGHLQLYSSERGVSFEKNHVKNDKIKLVKTIEYDTNVCVVGLNVNYPYSIHGVSERNTSEYPRLFGLMYGTTSKSFIKGPGIR